MRLGILFFMSVLFIASCTTDKESLFNGHNLDGWTIFVKDSTINPSDYFYVNDGCIETVGVPVGYLRTTKTYSNYELHVEWRYPEDPVNSGVFLHVNGPEQIWPNHYQAQLKHQNAGDFIVQGVGLSARLNGQVFASTNEEKPLIPKIYESNEKPAGEWNSYDITCDRKSIVVRVNGLLQNVATNCSDTKGAIGLQAEGSKIQFRNIWIKPIE